MPPCPAREYPHAEFDFRSSHHEATEEQEFVILKRRLCEYPEAALAVMQATHAMRKPVTAVTAREVEAWANPSA